jgi:hypothetical protein
MTTRLAALAAVLLMACPGPGTNDGGSDAGGVDAGTVDAGFSTVTLSGARTATIVGDRPNAQFIPDGDAGAGEFDLNATSDAGPDTTSYTFYFPGEPRVTTYAGQTDAGLDCFVYDTLPPSLDGWGANRGPAAADFGSCSVTFTSVTLERDVGTKRWYIVHGTATATLTARAGNATGTVDYSARF